MKIDVTCNNKVRLVYIYTVWNSLSSSTLDVNKPIFTESMHLLMHGFFSMVTCTGLGVSSVYGCYKNYPLVTIWLQW